eukprot:CAMPEP_0205906732 /NCGR_PEP_ID=MMETSP1325-20131115/2104_1 /ASSEMBLY_ACC=CAM_ASM_000708 /TAXON_ID=236786 /ORGANISM="Florenciella sp., Strain RCC1007" /LENGTH=164 /DNA_ID=CAMNT_0053272757 /DNA_START=109 /DNA_END=603 /DNA_ORIENTATION=+
MCLLQLTVDELAGLFHLLLARSRPQPGQIAGGGSIGFSLGPPVASSAATSALSADLVVQSHAQTECAEASSLPTSAPEAARAWRSTECHSTVSFKALIRRLGVMTISFPPGLSTHSTDLNSRDSNRGVSLVFPRNWKVSAHPLSSTKSNCPVMNEALRSVASAS